MNSRANEHFVDGNLAGSNLLSPSIRTPTPNTRKTSFLVVRNITKMCSNQYCYLLEVVTLACHLSSLFACEIQLYVNTWLKVEYFSNLLQIYKGDILDCLTYSEIRFK